MFVFYLSNRIQFSLGLKTAPEEFFLSYEKFFPFSNDKKFHQFEIWKTFLLLYGLKMVFKPNDTKIHLFTFVNGKKNICHFERLKTFHRMKKPLLAIFDLCVFNFWDVRTDTKLTFSFQCLSLKSNHKGSLFLLFTIM